ncbi:MAG: transglycosylase SLT domain-containing protein [Ktedonobacterales bacterium]
MAMQRNNRGFGRWLAESRSPILLVISAICLLAVAAGVLLIAQQPGGPLGPTNNGSALVNTAMTSTPAQQRSTHAVPRLPGLPALPQRTSQLAALDGCPTPTPLPVPTDTSTTPSAVPATDTPTDTPAAATPGSTCTACPFYKGDNPGQSDILQALATAATTYQLPINLLQAVAWQESRWHEDVLSCDGGIGLMQIQYYTYPWLNTQSIPTCGFGVTNYDPYTLQGNANLGAKLLKWLSCFYSYWGDNGGASLQQPGAYTIAWYYQQAGLQYPDTLNAAGSANANSLCAAVFNDPTRPEFAALPATTADPWSCPYSATTGDNTLLDMTLSAYNEGAGYTDQYGIQNEWYVQGVEGWIPQFANGALPPAATATPTDTTPTTTATATPGA